MFGGLREFLDEQYLAEHPVIQLMVNDSLSEYEIFSARITDVSGPAYAEQIITLSTCVGTDNDSRMVVQGALMRIVPMKTEYSDAGWNIMRLE